MPNLGESLAGKRVLVSGGTTGIGRAAVDLFADEGAKVFTFARTAEDVQKLQSERPDVIATTGDVTDKEGLTALVDEAIAKLGGIDILVNNAGIAGEGIDETPYEDWKSVIEVNLMGPMLLTQIAMEKLQPGSHIVNVGSLSAKSRGEGSDTYVATKSGLRGFTDSVSKTLAKKGIAVTLIEPGLTEADMTTENKTPEEVQKLKANAEMLESVDIAQAIVYAASQPPRVTVGIMQVHPRMESE